MDAKGYKEARACRSCGSASLGPVIDLGHQPLANDLRLPDEIGYQDTYPLAVVWCHQCTLVQLKGNVTPSIMFDDYAYLSSYSSTMVEAMRELVSQTLKSSSTLPRLVLEIASNDGYLLKHYMNSDIPVIGVEPAANVAQIARDNGVPTVSEYFGLGTARSIVADHGAADVIHANNVIAHVPDINDFVAGLAVMLDSHGCAFIESPYVGSLFNKIEFDTIYHEHVFYYSLRAMDTLMRRHGLIVVNIEKISLHGGSIRYQVRHEGHPVSDCVRAQLDAEVAEGMAEERYYKAFSSEVERLKAQTRALLSELVVEGARIAAYGASAKGAVLMNHFQLDEKTIEFVVDKNPTKQGRLMPGTRIPIRDERFLAASDCTHAILTVWNIADEVLNQEEEFRRRGGKFIVCIPEVQVV